MKFLLNRSLQYSAQERKSDKWTALTRALTVVFLSQVILGALNALFTLSLYGQVHPDQLLKETASLFDSYFTLYSSALTLFFMIVLGRKVEKRSWTSLGWTTKASKSNLAKTGLITMSLLFILVLLLNPSFYIQRTAQSNFLTVAGLFLGVLIYTAFQDFTFRSYLFTSLSVDGKVVRAIWLTALVQAALYLFNENMSWVALANVFLFSALLSYLFYLSDDILIPWLVNFICYIFFSLLLSSDYQGQAFKQSLFQVVKKNSQELFSFDHSILTFCILVLIIFYLHTLTMKKVVQDGEEK